MTLLPKTSCDLQCIDLQVLPPGSLAADLMQLPMVSTAKWHGKFIAHLQTHCSRLRKAQMVRIGGLSPAHQTRLRRHEFQVRLVAQPLGFGDGEFALVDFESRCQGRRHCLVFRCAGLITAKEIGRRALMSPPVVVRRPRNRRCVVGMESDTKRWSRGGRLQRWRRLKDASCPCGRAQAQTVCRMSPALVW